MTPFAMSEQRRFIYDNQTAALLINQKQSQRSVLLAAAPGCMSSASSSFLVTHMNGAFSEESARGASKFGGTVLSQNNVVGKRISTNGVL